MAKVSLSEIKAPKSLDISLEIYVYMDMPSSYLSPTKR